MAIFKTSNLFKSNLNSTRISQYKLAIFTNFRPLFVQYSWYTFFVLLIYFKIDINQCHNDNKRKNSGSTLIKPVCKICEISNGFIIKSRKLVIIKKHGEKGGRKSLFVQISIKLEILNPIKLVNKNGNFQNISEITFCTDFL